MILKGQCLCGDVRFEVEGPVAGIGQCHCSLCRKASGTNGNAVFLVPKARFSWSAGEACIVRFELRPSWSIARCSRCGSPLPQCYDGAQYWVPAGLMDDALDTQVKIHIHTSSMADWDRIPDGHRHFAQFPPGHPGNVSAKS